MTTRGPPSAPDASPSALGTTPLHCPGSRGRTPRGGGGSRAWPAPTSGPESTPRRPPARPPSCLRRSPMHKHQALHELHIFKSSALKPDVVGGRFRGLRGAAADGGVLASPVCAPRRSAHGVRLRAERCRPRRRQWHKGHASRVTVMSPRERHGERLRCSKWFGSKTRRRHRAGDGIPAEGVPTPAGVRPGLARQRPTLPSPPDTGATHLGRGQRHAVTRPRSVTTDYRDGGFWGAR